MSDLKEENIPYVSKAVVAPKLTCIGCNGFYRGLVRYCQNSHGVCSICLPGDKKQCPIEGCDKEAIVTLDCLSELVKDLRFPVSCKYRRDGCDQMNEEEKIAEHEIICRFRKVLCLNLGCPDLLAKDFEAHVFTAHQETYGKVRDNIGTWYFQHFGASNKLGAQQMWKDTESGLWFRFIIYHMDDQKQWKCSAIVFGGKDVAKQYRAEMRLSSYDVDANHIFNCNVSPIDDIASAALIVFVITDDQFKIYNKGHAELGDHNKDKNGELTMPVTFKIIKKKLNCA